MPTKLSRYCEGIMEAAWLVAVIVAPIFFNIYSSRIFEPDKATLVRTLALLVLGAWLIKLWEEGGARWEHLERQGSFLKSLLRVPLLAPAMGLLAIYLVATIFSVSPRISLMGSYQRMQGTYSMISYMVLFAALIGNLRKREQVDRLITTAILASLPVSLYGILQKYQIDPVPWGGNVSNRIAANLGNSIFVAAYLIMIVPLALGRVVQSFRAILKEESRLGPNLVRATLYVFIVAVQLVAIYMSGSRGPFLGLLAGLFFLFTLLALYWRKRWVMLTSIGAAAAIGIFLIVLNIPNGPLEGLRSQPWLGRFGQVFDTDQRTSQVRILIWEGAAELVGIHDPLQFPDGGQDTFNFMRPLIGYGPEGMYVSYNQFYPPELGRVEKRNASPDRSHNETWDSLVMTGVLGLAAYLAMFGAVFYYGLKWLGLVRGAKQRNLFLAFYLGGGLLGAVVLVAWQGIEFLGVGLPFGMVMGVLAYLTLFALTSKAADTESEQSNPGALVIIVLLAAVVAHFVEINFGIAIVATRTLFWIYAGLLLVTGYILPRHEAAEKAAAEASLEGEVAETELKRGKKSAASTKHRRMERSRSGGLGRGPGWLQGVLIGALISALLLATIGYDFVTNNNRGTNVFSIVFASMTTLPNKAGATSYGVLALVVTTWLASTLILTSEAKGVEGPRVWWRAWGLSLGVSALAALLFWFGHAIRLALLAGFSPKDQFDLLKQVSSLGGLLTGFYIFLLLIGFCLAYLMPETLPARNTSPRSLGWTSAVGVLVVVCILGYVTNLRVIHADVMFKMADPFTKNGQWEVATYLYKEALNLSPSEDHYYLFLGRSYLEQAKAAEEETDQSDLVLQAENDLKYAQEINPLNTDHTANLGRLYSWWSGKATDRVVQLERAQIASDYYGMAVTLSPNNPTLWGEWAILLLNVLGQSDLAYEKLATAIELDDQYNFTHGLMGDYYLNQARLSMDASERAEALEQAIYHYGQAAELTVSSDKSTKVGYLVSIGNAYIEVANGSAEDAQAEYLLLAAETYQEAIDLGPRATDLWKIEETLSRVYVQLGDKASALVHASAALASAPEKQIERLQTYLAQIEALP